MIDKQQIKEKIKEIGEQSCLGQLILAGKDAHLATNPNQEGWDIKVIEGEKEILVQVKTIVWKSMDLMWEEEKVELQRANKSIPVIKGQFKQKKFNYLVIVFLNFNEKNFTYYVIPADKLKEKSSDGSDRAELISSEGDIYHSTDNEDGSNQSISLSRLKDQEIQKSFQIYLEAFCSII